MLGLALAQNWPGKETYHRPAGTRTRLRESRVGRLPSTMGELHEGTLGTLRDRSDAVQGQQLARIVRQETWPSHYKKMWATHRLLNTFREEGRNLNVVRGR